MNPCDKFLVFGGSAFLSITKILTRIPIDFAKDYNYESGLTPTVHPFYQFPWALKPNHPPRSQHQIFSGRRVSPSPFLFFFHIEFSKPGDHDTLAVFQCLLVDFNYRFKDFDRLVFGETKLVVDGICEMSFGDGHWLDLLWKRLYKKGYFLAPILSRNCGCYIATLKSLPTRQNTQNKSRTTAFITLKIMTNWYLLTKEDWINKMLQQFLFITNS